jgi:phosphatidylinositol alpha-1,6-mannosyltransferase
MKNKINKIFFISTEYPPAPGGIGTHAYNLLKNLRDLGWETIVATNQEYVDETEVADFNNKQNYVLLRLQTSITIMLLLKKIFFLIKEIRKHKPDVIMGSGRHASYFAYICAFVTFKKCVLVGHGTEFIMKLSPRSTIINKWVYSKASSIIYVSKYTQKVAEENGIHNNNPIILYNGADNVFFKTIPDAAISQFKTEQGITSQKIIITTGTISERKGQATVVRAMPEILKKVPNAHYYSIGMSNGPFFEKVSILTKEVGVESNVHFLGRRSQNELLNWLNAADVYVLPSAVVPGKDIEGFGISVIEAAFCKKPAVVTDQSGAIESIEPNITGLVATMGEPASMAEKLIALLKNEDLCRKMGDASLKRANESFTWAKATLEYHKYLIKFIGKIE